jgi:hypothetical protein
MKVYDEMIKISLYDITISAEKMKVDSLWFWAVV